MIKGIATQAELAAFLDGLDNMASNLTFHVNETSGVTPGSSLSQAHGIDLVVGYVDAYNNDLRTYQDSNGDRVSDDWSTDKANFVRFIVGGQPYWAPLQTSTLEGQPRGTGALSSTDPTVGLPGGSTLITDYITDEAVAATNLDSLLHEHTKLSHTSAHGALTVTPSSTTDSAGHAIGTHLIVFQYNGLVYHLPVSDRFGGPAQPIRLSSTCPVASFVGTVNGNFGLSGCTLNMKVKGGAEWPTAVVLTTTIAGGTAPIAYTWQYYNGSTWIDQAVSTQVPGTGTGGLIPASGIVGSTNVGTIVSQWTTASPGNDDGNTWLMRLKLDNSAVGGSVVYGCTITVEMQDKSACCWFCTQANLTRRLTPEEWEKVGRTEQRLWGYSRRMVTWYLKQGETLVQKMLAGGVSQDWFVTFAETLLATYQAQGLDAAARYYALQVGEAVERYWPECAARGYRAGLNWRNRLGLLLHAEEQQVRVGVCGCQAREGHCGC